MIELEYWKFIILLFLALIGAIVCLVGLYYLVISPISDYIKMGSEYKNFYLNHYSEWRRLKDEEELREIEEQKIEEESEEVEQDDSGTNQT